MKFHLAINLERNDDSLDMADVAQHTLEMVQMADQTGFDIAWEGEGVDEKGRDRETGSILVEIDPKYFRPAEVDLLQGDPSKAAERLGWKPKVTFFELVKIMMLADLELVGVAD